MAVDLLDGCERVGVVKQLTRIVALLALVALPATALATASSQVWVPNCIKAQYKPAQLTLSCGDHNNYLTKLKWSSWTTTQATGSGTNEVNNCTPSCVAGHFKAYPVLVTLSKPKRCPKVSHKVFGHISIKFTGKHPGSSRSTGGPLACPY
jgi:hypothetical protein